MESSLSTPPPPTSYHHIYVAFGSKQSNWMARFDPSNNTWSYVSSIFGVPNGHVLKEFAMVSIGDLIYIIGGRLCRKERHVSDNCNGLDQFSDSEVQVRSEVLCYNVKYDQWSQCASLSMPRYNFACTVCDSKIYVAGGQYELASARSTSRVEVYNPLLDEWTQLPSMRRLRYKCVGVAWQGKVHVVGGFVDGCDVDQPTACMGRCSAEVYDDQRAQWDLVPRMWQLDVPPNQILVVEDNLFSSGDCLNAWKGHIEVYDGRLNLWNVVEGSQMKFQLNHPSAQTLYITMASIGPYLYLLAGHKSLSGNTFSIVYKFDTIVKSVWTSLGIYEEEGERELCSHCCVVTHS